jgi:hypothetical protein
MSTKKEELVEPTVTEAQIKSENWMASKWRPMMAMTYMIICLCDFVLFPILWTIVQFWETQDVNDAFREWNSLTLQSGGFIHITFMAILGISAWTRGQEKIENIKSGNSE